ncbi:Kinesin-like protein KIF21B [Smittium mucronatum]|uniref:Kinesin-like protein KIF21B n=1 Tax=Smittium mucronatum TaxID=133383 RepID=A0A1R0GY62_9FUNG|nr:Kinesin-like protein KIF21B [Smittium mucronatum]
MGLVAQASDHHLPHPDKRNDFSLQRSTPDPISHTLENNNSKVSMKVKVAVRVKPTINSDNFSSIKQSKKNQDSLIVNSSESDIRVLGSQGLVGGIPRVFKYDYVFDVDCNQHQIYETSVLPLVHKFYEGFNVTVFAYGQTGSGKSYTMGTKGEPNEMGIVGYSLKDIFSFARNSKMNKDSIKREFKASYIEIYNEELIDLIAEAHGSYGKPPVQIREDSNGRIIWSGAVEQKIDSAEEAMNLLLYGSMIRQTGQTEMNNQSSRSHAIFMIVQTQTEIRDGIEMQSISKFNFVDLAGSERLKKTKAIGDRAKEGISINSGLLALGNVISALAEVNEKNQTSANHNFVPYRNSKLTRLLQDSLGGTAYTIMIACVSISKMDILETLNTLKYASRAGSIKNAGSNNWESLDSVLKLQISDLKQQVSQLKEMLRLKNSSDEVGLKRRDSSKSDRDGSEKSFYKNRLFEMEALVRDLQTNLQSTDNAYSDLQDKYNHLADKMNNLDSFHLNPPPKFNLIDQPELSLDDSNLGFDLHPDSFNSSNVLYSKDDKDNYYNQDSIVFNSELIGPDNQEFSHHSESEKENSIRESSLTTETRLRLSARLHEIKNKFYKNILLHKNENQRPSDDLDYDSDASNSSNYSDYSQKSQIGHFSDLDELVSDYELIIKDLEYLLYENKKQLLTKESQISTQKTKLDFADQLSRSQSAQLTSLKNQISLLKESSQNEQDRRLYVESLLESLSSDKSQKPSPSKLSPHKFGSEKINDSDGQFSINEDSTEMHLVMEIERLKHEHSIEIQNLNAQHEQEIFEIENEHSQNLIDLEKNFQAESDKLNYRLTSLESSKQENIKPMDGQSDYAKNLERQNKELLKKLSESTNINEISSKSSSPIKNKDHYSIPSSEIAQYNTLRDENESLKIKLDQLYAQRDDMIEIINNSEKDKINSQNDRKRLQLLLGYAQNEVIERTGAFKQLQIIAYNAQIYKSSPPPVSQRSSRFSVDDMALNDYENYKNKVAKISKMLPEEKKLMLTRESFGIIGSYQSNFIGQDQMLFKNNTSHSQLTNSSDQPSSGNTLKKNLTLKGLPNQQLRNFAKGVVSRDVLDKDYMINPGFSPFGIYDDGVAFDSSSPDCKNGSKSDFDTANNRISLHAWLDSEAPLSSPPATVGFSGHPNSDTNNFRFSHDSNTMVGSSSYIGGSNNSQGNLGSVGSLFSMLYEQSRNLREKVSLLRIDTLDPGPYPISLSTLDYSNLDDDTIKRIHLDLLSKIEILTQTKNNLISMNDVLLKTFESFEAQTAILISSQKASQSPTKNKNHESTLDNSKQARNNAPGFAGRLARTTSNTQNEEDDAFNSNTDMFDSEAINSRMFHKNAQSKFNNLNSKDSSNSGLVQNDSYTENMIESGNSNKNRKHLQPLSPINEKSYKELFDEKTNLLEEISRCKALIIEQENRIKQQEILTSSLRVKFSNSIKAISGNSYTSDNDKNQEDDIVSRFNSLHHFDKEGEANTSQDHSVEKRSLNSLRDSSNFTSTDPAANGMYSMHLTRVSIDGIDLESELIENDVVIKNRTPEKNGFYTSSIPDLVHENDKKIYINGKLLRSDAKSNIHSGNEEPSSRYQKDVNDDSIELDISEFVSEDSLEFGTPGDKPEKLIESPSSSTGEKNGTLDGISRDIHDGNYSFGEDGILSKKIMESNQLALELKSELELVKGNLTKSELNLKKRQERIAELEEELSAHKSLISALEQSLEIFESQVSEMNEDKNRYTNELMRAKSETNMVNEQMARLSFQLAEAIKNAEVEAKDRDIWRSRYKDLQAETEERLNKKKHSSFLCF